MSLNAVPGMQLMHELFVRTKILIDTDHIFASFVPQESLAVIENKNDPKR